MKTERQSKIHPYGNLHTSIWQQNIRTGEIIQSSGADEQYPAASLSKLFIAAATVHLAEQEEVNLNEYLTISTKEFDEGDYGTGRLRLFSRLPFLASKLTGWQLIPPYRVEELLRYAVYYSDNIAALKITNRVGRERIQRVLDGWGLDQTTILNPETGQPNVTTAQNMGQFLYELGRGHLVEDDHLSMRMLRWMRTSNVVNKEGSLITIRYKDGQITENGYSYAHRAGYVQGLYSDHSFVVLTRDRAVLELETTYPQQERVRSVVEEIAYGLI